MSTEWTLPIVLSLMFSLASGALLMALYPWVRPLLARCAPATASALLLGMAALPLLLGIALTLRVLYPQPDSSTAAHCHTQTCAPHAPLELSAVVAGWMIWPAILAVLIIVAVRTWRLLRAWRWARSLAGLSEPHKEWHVVPDTRAWAVTLGLWRPGIYLSQGLLERCDPTTRSIVLAHERAHQRRRDPLRLAMAAVLLCVLPPAWSRTYFSDLRVVTERACDEQAALTFPRDRVAQAVLALARQQVSAPELVSAFADSAVEERVQALLREPASARVGVWFVLALGCYASVALGASGVLHQLIEALVGSAG